VRHAVGVDVKADIVPAAPRFVVAECERAARRGRVGHKERQHADHAADDHGDKVARPRIVAPDCNQLKHADRKRDDHGVERSDGRHRAHGEPDRPGERNPRAPGRERIPTRQAVQRDESEQHYRRVIHPRGRHDQNHRRRNEHERADSAGRFAERAAPKVVHKRSRRSGEQRIDCPRRADERAEGQHKRSTNREL
jgi:hypothetical protein